MSSNSFSPYTVPYSGVVGTANFVPGAATHHHPASQDKCGQGGFRLPAVAEEPVAADTAHSKGESMAAGGAAGGPPQDAIPVRFASAGVSAASGGIAVVNDSLGAGGFPPSSDVYAAGGLGQMSGQMKKQSRAVSSNNKGPLAFGTDGQHDGWAGTADMPPSPTMMTMSAQRHADRALPVVARELEAVKEDNQRLRDANARLQSRIADKDASDVSVAGLQSANEQLQTQVDSLYKQMADIQLQAQRFCFKSDRLRVRLTNTEDSLMELVDLIVRLENIISRIDPDIFVTFPFEVQQLLASIHEEWKYQEYCKCFKPEELEDDASSVASTVIEPESAAPGATLSLTVGPSYATATVSSAGLRGGSATTGNAAAAASGSSSANPARGAADVSNSEILRLLFQDFALGNPNNTGSGRQTPHRAWPSENLLDFSSPGTPSSIGTPRSVYSSSSEDAQGAHVAHGHQASQTAHATLDDQDAEPGQTAQGMTATDSVDTLGIRNNSRQH
ncbi:hypothetical protein LX36DRAFT_733594 [Colletotrichum falcatum]|nr:hypothetical protein LX36DRAFT_733594 [Colletotrichum falcatum]